MAKLVNQVSQVSELVESLLSARRSLPVCLVSTPHDSNTPNFDIERLEGDVGSVCEVVVVVNGDVTRELQRLLADESHVYGGSARVYPLNFGAFRKPGRLRYVYPAHEIAKSTDRLASDIWAAALDAGLLERASNSSVPTDATIASIFEDSVAVAKTDKFGLISIRQEVICPGVPLSWVLDVGQVVKGRYDVEARIFSLENSSLNERDLVSHFGFDTVTLGLVRATDRKSARIAVTPSLEFDVSKEEITGNPLDVISEYLRVGEVWPVRIYRDQQGRTRLKMNDVDDDEVVVESLPIIDGGRPWLDQARYANIDDDTTDSVEEVDAKSDAPVLVLAEPTPDFEPEGAPEAVVHRTPEEAKSHEKRLHESVVAYYLGRLALGDRELERLRDESKTLANLLRETEHKVRIFKEEAGTYKALVAEARKSKMSPKPTSVDLFELRNSFETYEEWFRELVRRAWIDTFSPDDRKRYPLSEDNWGFGDKFLESINPRAVDGSELAKVIRVVLFLVTGRNNAEHTITFHPTRDDGGREHTRGGDIGLRMHIENGQPQAKRLHYYKLASGGFELTKVCLHDDYKHD